MSTTLLPEGFREFRSLQNTENETNLLFPLGTKSQKVSALGGFAAIADSLTRGSAPGPRCGSVLDPRYKLAICVHPTFLTGDAPANPESWQPYMQFSWIQY